MRPFSEATDGGGTVTELYAAGMIAIIILGYLVSIWRNPWVTCSRCKNKPKSKGWIFGYAHHFCPKCKGTGQQLRFGRKALFGPPK